MSCSASSRSSHHACSGPVNSASSARPRKCRACACPISSASPLSLSFSRAYSWMVSSIIKRGSPSGPSSCRSRLLSTSEETPSKASMGRSPCASQTASIASSVRPPEKMAIRAKSVFSPSSRRVWLHSMAPLRVLCLSGRSLAPPVRSLRRLVRRARMELGGKSFMRAAASSMARGSPSRRAQISATAGAFSEVISKPAFVASARSIKSLTASYWERTSKVGNLFGSGIASGGTAYSRSP